MMDTSEATSLRVPDVRVWEEAYKRFETPQEEIRKFIRRLRAIGASNWAKDARIVELFCGRGNGLIALAQLGFTRIEGIDLSCSLLSQYTGMARCYVGDCRHLPFDSRSKDIIVIQGGLHHLQILPEDLEQCFREMHRILTDQGRVVIIEPWLTPFLSCVHWLCRQKVARLLSTKLDSLATMIEYERDTYSQWLSQQDVIRNAIERYFIPVQYEFLWGKLIFVGGKRIAGHSAKAQ